MFKLLWKMSCKTRSGYDVEKEIFFLKTSECLNRKLVSGSQWAHACERETLGICKESYSVEIRPDSKAAIPRFREFETRTEYQGWGCAVLTPDNISSELFPIQQTDTYLIISRLKWISNTINFPQLIVNGRGKAQAAAQRVLVYKSWSRV